MPPEKTQQKIRYVAYSPQPTHRHDVEVLSFSELRQRAPVRLLRRSERLGFGLLLGVHTGHCEHRIDFTQYPLKPGDWLVLAPGQVQQYDLDSDWDGIMLVCKPSMLQPVQTHYAGLDHDWTLPSLMAWRKPVVTLNEATHHTCMALAAQIRADTQQLSDIPGLERLLQLQLHALLWRLYKSHHATTPAHNARSNHSQREHFLRFLHRVEQRFSHAHQVLDYINDLGCTERTLNRACQEMAGCSAKMLIARRIVLEAQRLLVHTDLPVSSIAHQLGFDEPTHFGKFFRREAGCAPGEFRRQHPQ